MERFVLFEVVEEDEIRQQLEEVLFAEECERRGLREFTREEEQDYFNDLLEEAGEKTIVE